MIIEAESTTVTGLRKYPMAESWFLATWPLVVFWLAWWLWAADWRKLGPALAQGAWAPVVMLAILGALVWAVLFPSTFPLTWLGMADRQIPNFLWQFLATCLLFASAGFMGWLQQVYRWQPPEVLLEPAASDTPGHHAQHDGATTPHAGHEHGQMVAPH
jgi:hypothetical protein